MGAIGLVAGAAHAAVREQDFDPELAVTFTAWMTGGAAGALAHLGAIPEFAT
jgi:hypothetical protein